MADETRSDPAPCAAVTRRGAPCNGPALQGSRFCWAHDPALAEQRRTWSKRGGEGRSNVSRAAKRLPKDLADVKASLMRTLQALEGGEMEPARATAIGAVARAVVSVTEAGAVEDRLASLEAAAGLGDGRRPA